MQANQVAAILLLALGFLLGSPLPAHSATETAGPAATDRYGDPLPAGAVARLGPRGHHHGGQVRALDFSADGKSLIGYTFSALLVWDAATGKIQKRRPFPVPLDVEGQTGVCSATSTLAVPQLVARLGGGFAARVQLWDLASGKKTRTLALPDPGGQTRPVEALVTSLSFSADGKLLLVGIGRISRLRVVDVASGRVRIALDGASITAMSPDGKALAAVVARTRDGAWLHEVQLWDVATAKHLRTLYPEPARRDGPGSVQAIAYSPDSKLLALSIDDVIVLCDSTTGANRGNLQPARKERCLSLAFAPDGKRLVSVSEPGGMIRVWDVASAKTQYAIEGGPHLWRSIAVSPDGRTMALGSRGNAVRLWDIASAKELVGDPVWHDLPIRAMSFSADGKTLISAADRKVLFSDLATGKVGRTLPASTGVASFSPDGKYLATVSNPNQGVLVREMASGDELPLIMAPDYLRTMKFSLDGRNLLTVGSSKAGYHVRRWNVETGKQQGSHILPVRDARALALSSDFKKVAVMPYGGGLSVHYLESGRQIRLRNSNEWREFLGTILDISDDGRVLIMGGRQTRQWELVSGKQIGVLENGQDTAAVTVHTRNGRYLACGGNAGAQVIPIWDLSTGKQVARFGDLHANVTALTFGPGDAFLAAGLLDGSILIFDTSKVTAKTRSPGSPELDSLWADLGGSNVGKAHEALWKMVDASEQVVPFLKNRLRPVAVRDRARLQQWISNLDSPRFAVRQAATRELEKNVGSAAGLLRDALKNNPSLETSRRLQQILNLLDNPGPETVRTIRAIMVLDRIGGAEARAILKHLARGVPGANETEEAKASLQRLR
jgi:WD40 repeat protein